MINARAAKLSDYSYPITKSSNWTAVIGYPRDRATITLEIAKGARRTNHGRVIKFDYVQFCSIIELTKSSLFDFVRLPNTTKFNRTIMFDYFRLCLIEISVFDFVRLDTPGKIMQPK